MSPRSTARFTLSLLLLALGVVLLTLRTDREYINLRPSEGAAHSFILKSDERYRQTFIATRETVTRLGLYFSPATSNLPNESVTIQLLRGEDIIATSHVSSSFIETGNATQFRFAEAIPTRKGETITIEIEIPPSLSQKISLQERMRDDTFSRTDTFFYINGQPQPNPLAYQVYYRYHPARMLQLGGLAILASIFTFFYPFAIRHQQITVTGYALLTPLLYLVPQLSFDAFSWPIYFYSATALLGMYLLLRSSRLQALPALFGAHVFAFTTWYPLHALAGREPYLVIALLPLFLFFLFEFDRLSNALRWTIPLGLILLTFIFLAIADSKPLETTPTATAHIRDIFLDPNQVPSSQKVSDPTASWDHFGSYVGLAAAVAAGIGIWHRAKGYLPILAIGLIGALASLSPLVVVAYRIVPFPAQHLVILVTLAIAFFAGHGMQKIRDFLGTDKLITGILVIISILALLDLWQVAAYTLEFPLI